MTQPTEPVCARNLENSSQSETMLRTLQSRKFEESKSPRMSIKPVGSGKDGKCLLCGLDFKISGKTLGDPSRTKSLETEFVGC